MHTLALLSMFYYCQIFCQDILKAAGSLKEASVCDMGFFLFFFCATIRQSGMRDLKYWRLNLGGSRGPLSSIESVSRRHQIRTEVVGLRRS